MSIPFTQYLRPDGRKKQEEVDRPEEVEKKAKVVIEAGFRFEAEVLTTGQVHIDTCNIEEQLCSRISPNGPELLDHIDSLVEEAYRIVLRRRIDATT